MGQKLTLVFPMAGEGARFGYRFKPFLSLRGETFIAAAVAPFRPWMAQIERICFVFTRAQEETHNVSARLAQIFTGLPIQCVMLEKATRGPAETLLHCLQQADISGPALVCDCDHAVDVDGLMQVATAQAADCAVPTWSLDGEPVASWGVAAVDRAGHILAVKEKALPDCVGDKRGIIGCYYFADIAAAGARIASEDLTYISDIMRRLIADGADVRSVAITEAEFFGDMVRFERLTGEAEVRFA